MITCHDKTLANGLRLVAVEMPQVSDGLARISKALLSAEIDIHYCYALITSERIRRDSSPIGMSS